MENRIKKTALMGLAFAGIIALTALEQALPPLPFMPPSVRFGLSNVIIMYCIIAVSKTSAFTLVALKACFAFITRGHIAGLLSLAGGVLSFCVITLLVICFKDTISYGLLSILGAVSHNIGQYAAVSALLRTNVFLYYLPVLIIFGVLSGFVTGICLKQAFYYTTRYTSAPNAPKKNHIP